MIPIHDGRCKNQKATPKRIAPPPPQATVQFLIDPSPRGPKLCLRCHQPFKKDEAWQRQTSPTDSRFGSYAIGIHDRCLPKA